MNIEDKAFEILKHIAIKNAEGESITLANDWELGTGTIIFKDGSHTHFGFGEDDEIASIECYINGLYSLLIENKGLSTV